MLGICGIMKEIPGRLCLYIDKFPEMALTVVLFECYCRPAEKVNSNPLFLSLQMLGVADGSR